MKILIVDDAPSLAEILAEFVSDLGDHEVFAETDARKASQMLHEQAFDLLITDVQMPYIDGITLSQEALNKKCNVVLVSGIAHIIRSINALSIGVIDFLTKPIDLERLKEIILQLEDSLQQKPSSTSDEFYTHISKDSISIDASVRAMKNCGILKQNMIACSDPMKKVVQQLDKLHNYPDIIVLLNGKTGTGKEVLSRYIHSSNKISTSPYIAVNCSAISNDLFESELFGYTPNAFTGASTKGQQGKIDMARKGTLLLDEISEISPSLQVKLLRVLQEKEYFQVGGNNPRKVETRVVCATNRNLKKMIQQGHFREDLFFRISTCTITIPPLSKRKDDIIPLSLYFLKTIIDENLL